MTTTFIRGENPLRADKLNAAFGERVSRSGDTMQGVLRLAQNPVAPFDAATKQYVDQHIGGGGGVAPDNDREINVLDYGAQGDNVIDDASAFAAAWRAVAAGGKLVVPPGSYKIGTSLPQTITGSVSFVGAGSGVTILNFSSDTDGVMISLSGTTNIHVHGMTIKRMAAGVYTHTGLSIVSPTPNNAGEGITDVYDVVMSGVWLLGINIVRTLAALTNASVLMANASGSGPGVGIKVSGVDTNNYCTSVRLNNVITIGGNTGFLIGTWVQGVYVNACDFIGNDYGLQWAGVAGNADLWLAVTNSHFNSGTRGVLTFNGLSTQVTNTYSLHFGIPSIDNIYAAFEFHNISPGMISDCSMYGMGAGSTSFQEYAILLSGGYNVIVSDNHIEGHKNAGIYVNVTKQTLITGNIAGLPPGVPLIQYAAFDASNQAYGNQLNSVPDMSMDGNNHLYIHDQLTITGLANTNRMLIFANDTGSRWFFGIDGGTTEGAGNVGGDLTLISAGDSGLIENMFRVKRSTGKITLAHPLTYSGPFINAANDAAAASAGVQVGEEYRNGSVKMIRVA